MFKHAPKSELTVPTELKPSDARPKHELPQPYTVVLVGYNSQYWLAKHLPFYQACQHLVIVDNASVDTTCDYVRTQLPQATLIANAQNQGFGAACNQGAAAATTPYVLLLNPDCTCDHATVAQLLAVAEHDPQAAIVAPQVMTKRGTPEVSYRMGLLTWKSTLKPAAHGLLCVEFVTGACFLMRKTAFDAIGGFDEAYFMYYEDEDLCLRLRKAGFAIVVEPAAVVQHFARSGSQQSDHSHYFAKQRSAFKGEYARGQVHTASKIRFYSQYLGPAYGKTLRRKLLLLALCALPFRALQSPFQSKYLGRVVGRIQAIVRG